MIVVEGPNDVMNLLYLAVPAVAVCSNTVTDEQVEKPAELAKEFGANTVSVMFDLDRDRENGSKQAILALAERCRVPHAWTPQLYDGRFVGRQPESIALEDTRFLRAFIDVL